MTMPIESRDNDRIIVSGIYALFHTYPLHKFH